MLIKINFSLKQFQTSIYRVCLCFSLFHVPFWLFSNTCADLTTTVLVKLYPLNWSMTFTEERGDKTENIWPFRSVKQERKNLAYFFSISHNTGNEKWHHKISTVITWLGLYSWDSKYISEKSLRTCISHHGMEQMRVMASPRSGNSMQCFPGVLSERMSNKIQEIAILLYLYTN